LRGANARRLTAEGRRELQSSERIFVPRKLQPMTAKPTSGEFREKVRERYDQAIAQIDPIIDLAIALARTRTGRLDDPVGFTEIQKMLETAVTVYTAKCGPLETSSAAWLMLKAISKSLLYEPR
jgi:hypothetical protein